MSETQTQTQKGAKEIRFVFSKAEHYKQFTEFQRLCILNGETEGEGVARLIAIEMESSVAKKLYQYTWVTQNQLIAELARVGLSTNPVTLYNYRTKDKIRGLFKENSSHQGLLYNLEGMTMFFRSLPSRQNIQNQKS